MIKWVSTWDDLKKYYDDFFKFAPILEDSTKFKKTSWVARGRKYNTPIYQGIFGKYRGKFFYRDQLHGDHCEVFNESKAHYGEMDFGGNIDETRADSTKRWPGP